MAKKKTSIVKSTAPLSVEETVKAILEPEEAKPHYVDDGTRKRLNAQIPSHIYNQFTDTANRNGHNISALVRIWIDKYLKENE